MISLTLSLTLIALVFLVLSMIGKGPLWPAVLMLIILELLRSTATRL